MTLPSSPASDVPHPAGAGASTFTCTVYGPPAPQGSKRHVGRGVMVESSAKVKPWREAVKWAALDAGTRSMGWEPMTGPLAVRMVFTLPKPKSAPKRTRIWPVKRPDWDKLARACSDSLTDAAVYGDDAQVVEATVRKVFPGEDPEALAAPGVVISVWPVT